MDWQRDDRLGRIQLHPRPLLQHRREILRAIRGDAYTDANTNSDSDSYVNCDTECYSDSDAYGNGHAEAYADAKA
jgi:hypothetical protein